MYRHLTPIICILFSWAFCFIACEPFDESPFDDIPSAGNTSADKPSDNKPSEDVPPADVTDVEVLKNQIYKEGEQSLGLVFHSTSGVKKVVSATSGVMKWATNN